MYLVTLYVVVALFIIFPNIEGENEEDLEHYGLETNSFLGFQISLSYALCRADVRSENIGGR